MDKEKMQPLLGIVLVINRTIILIVQLLRSWAVTSEKHIRNRANIRTILHINLMLIILHVFRGVRTNTICNRLSIFPLHSLSTTHTKHASSLAYIRRAA